jgi:hypothetical protein
MGKGHRAGRFLPDLEPGYNLIRMPNRHGEEAENFYVIPGRANGFAQSAARSQAPREPGSSSLQDQQRLESGSSATRWSGMTAANLGQESTDV